MMAVAMIKPYNGCENVLNVSMRLKQDNDSLTLTAVFTLEKGGGGGCKEIINMWYQNMCNPTCKNMFPERVNY